MKVRPAFPCHQSMAITGFAVAIQHQEFIGLSCFEASRRETIFRISVQCRSATYSAGVGAWSYKKPPSWPGLCDPTIVHTGVRADP